jgi:F420H(2)-dependent quinone reductase
MTTTIQTRHRVPVADRLVLAMLSTATGRRLLPGLSALRFTGRRSGQPVVLPVARAAAGTDVMVLVGRSAAKRWWRNFRGGHPVEVLVDGRWRHAVGETVTAERLEYPRLLAAYRATHHHTPADTREPIVHIVLRPAATPVPAR